MYKLQQTVIKPIVLVADNRDTDTDGECLVHCTSCLDATPLRSV